VRGGGAKRLLLLGLCASLALLFAGLGVWQVERLWWKLDLIDRVEARLAAPPQQIGSLQDLQALPSRELEYRKVRVRGRFDHGRETLVEALTERGPGFWVLTPLVTSDGTILVNRGFVPPGRRLGTQRAAGQVEGPTSVTGLLRLSEPGGRFLRTNRPQAERWYSRDVRAIAEARGIARPASVFLDADAAANPGGLPVGGLTVVRFRNTHLIYALTWFGLAALSLWGLVLVARSSAKRG
jgi:surfeit locus 1 family protein